MVNHIRTSIVLVLGLVAMGAGWPTDAGGPGRERNSAVPLESGALVPVWTIETVDSTALLVADIDGDPDDEVLYVMGGRVRAVQESGHVEWLSLPVDAQSVLPPVDLTGDGRPELVVLKRTAGIAVLHGIDGTVLWESNPEVLSRVTRVLFRDLNEDGAVDLLAVDYGFALGRAVAYSLSSGRASELFRLEEESRDYNNVTSGIGFADLDGQGGPEVVVLGSRYAYVYSGQDGRLLGQTEDIGSIPYGLGSLYVGDLDRDGDEEVVVATNNNNGDLSSRRLMMLDRSVDAALTKRWEHSVSDVINDRHIWSDTSLSDLDGDGLFEFVHAIFDNNTGAWTTYVRRASDGEIVAETPGIVLGVTNSKRLLVAEPTFQTVGAWTYDGALNSESSYEGDGIIMCSRGLLPDGRASQEVYLNALRNPISVDVLDGEGYRKRDRRLFANHGTTTLSMDLAPGENVALSCRSESLVFISRKDGELEIYEDLASEPRLAEQRSPSQQLSAFLIPDASSGVDGSWVLGRGNLLFDATGASLDNPAQGVRLGWAVAASADVMGDGRGGWLGWDLAARVDLDDVAGMSYRGDPVWTIDDILETNDGRSVVWYYPTVGPDLNGDGTLDLLLQTGESARDVMQVRPVSGRDGQDLWGRPFEGSFVGQGAGIPVGYKHNTEGRVASMVGGQLRIHDATGQVLKTVQGTGFVARLIATRTLSGETRLVSGASLGASWQAFDTEGEKVWRTDGASGGWSGTELSVARDSERVYLMEGRRATTPQDHNLVVLDLEDGSVLHKLYVHEGRVNAPVTDVSASVSLNAGIGFDGDSEHPARYVVTDNEGYLYVLAPGADSNAEDYPANMLVASYDFGRDLGVPSAADVDGDGFAEIVLPDREGTAFVLDHPELDAVLEVFDTECGGGSGVDVDEVSDVDVFCASWTVTTNGDSWDGFFVTLLDEETFTRVAETRVVKEVVRFEGLRLTAGRRYFVEVLAFRGDSSSSVFSSDGAVVVVSDEPPEIVLTADPRSFVAGEGSSEIKAQLRDISGLAEYQLWIEGASGEVYREGALLNTIAFRKRLVWTGQNSEGEPLPTGSYRVVVEASDFGGLESRSELVVELEPGVELGEDVSEADLAWDVGQASDVKLITEERVPACGCRVTGGGGVPREHGIGLWWVMLVLAYRVSRSSR